MPMKMETIEELLKRWGELIVTTSGGQTFELHLGDTTFDAGRRVITFKSSGAEFILDGDSIESVQMHYSHLAGDED